MSVISTFSILAGLLSLFDRKKKAFMLLRLWSYNYVSLFGIPRAASLESERSIHGEAIEFDRSFYSQPAEPENRCKYVLAMPWHQLEDRAYLPANLFLHRYSM
jgi:hypothetical protein